MDNKTRISDEDLGLVLGGVGVQSAGFKNETVCCPQCSKNAKLTTDRTGKKYIFCHSCGKLNYSE